MNTVVNPVTGTVVDTQFMDTFPEHFTVPKQPRMQPFNSRGYSCYRPSVFQFIKPNHNRFSPLFIPENPNFIHGENVT